MKNKSRNMTLLGLVLGLSACTANTVPSSSAPQPTEETAVRDDDIYIFYTGDIHCDVEDNLTLPSVKAIVNDTKADHPYVALVDSGDYIQGGTLGSFSKGELIIDLMNKMEYDVVTLGNHEFDYGMDRLKELIDEMNFDLVVSNITYTGKKEDIFKDIPKYVIKDYGGTKVAFIGIVTPESVTSSTPLNFMEDNEYVYDFGKDNDGTKLAGIVQKAVDEARGEGADFVIALSHLGAADMDDPFNSVNIINKTTGIDAFLDGHAHIVVPGTEYPNADGENVLLLSTGTKLQNVGELIISPDGVLSSLLISEYDKKDEEILNAISEADAEIDKALSEKVCDLAFDMTLSDENGIRISRTRETTLGNLAADAFRSELEADCAFVNGGALRKDLSAGEVKKRDLLEVFPFQNTTGVCRATGEQILNALEYGAAYTEHITSFDDAPVGESGGFLSVSGLKYTIDTSVPSSAVKDENGMFTGVEGERRVKDVMILQGDEYVPLDPKASYTVASSSYILFVNGDGNTAFQDSEVLIKEGTVDLDVLISYITKIGGIPETYKETEGRITIK